MNLGTGKCLRITDKAVRVYLRNSISGYRPHSIWIPKSVLISQNGLNKNSEFEVQVEDWWASQNRDRLEGNVLSVKQTSESREEWGTRGYGYFWLFEDSNGQKKTKKEWIRWGRKNDRYIKFN